MRTPRGFGKNYFTLAAIQAYASAATQHRHEACVHAYTLKIGDECDDEVQEEDDPCTLVCTSALSLPEHAGHCNCYYRRITRNRIRLNPKPRFSIPPYIHANSTLSPPSAFPAQDNTIYNQEGNLCKNNLFHSLPPQRSVPPFSQRVRSPLNR